MGGRRQRIGPVAPLAAFVLVLVALAAAGCAPLPARPAQTVSELEWQHREGKQEFTAHMIVLHNVRRVLSADLPPGERIESLRVVEQLKAPQAETYPALAPVLAEPGTPQPVRHAVLGFLARKRYPGLADHVAKALPHARDRAFRDAILEWLLANPSPNVLSDVVKLWAAEAKCSDADEARYRRIVEKVSGTTWDRALLGGLNSTGAFPRGSAIEILAARVPADALQRKLAALSARSHDIRAMQYFADQFGFIPTARRELFAVAKAFETRRRALIAVAERANRWQRESEYRFNIRDLHLIASLAADPQRRAMSRRLLEREVAAAIAARQRAGGAGGSAPIMRGGRLVGFDAQKTSLTVADLWNLLLIDEMLSQQWTRVAIRKTAQDDRADTRTAWGGLIVYRNGRAEAEVHPATERRGDEQFIPPPAMRARAINALATFVGHFRRDALSDASVGPTDAELKSAKRQNICGLVLSTLVRGRLNATYYNPDGIVIDLGNYPLGE